MFNPDIPPPPPPPPSAPPPAADPSNFDDGTTQRKRPSTRTGLKITLSNSPGVGPSTPGASY